jgi:hypothetical protein
LSFPFLCGFGAVRNALHIHHARAVRAAEKLSLRFIAMAHDLAAAVSAARSQHVDCAFKAVEGVRLSIHNHLEGLIILISARVTACHFGLPVSSDESVMPRRTEDVNAKREVPSEGLVKAAEKAIFDFRIAASAESGTLPTADDYKSFVITV